MRVDCTKIRLEDVTTWNSIRADRITLPYKHTGEICEYAYMLILGATPYFGGEDDMKYAEAFDTECLHTMDNSIVTATLRILPYTNELIAGIGITVDTADGRHLEHRILGKAEPGTIETILDRFFSTGAVGLSPMWYKHWKGKYEEYRKAESNKIVSPPRVLSDLFA